MTNSFLKKVTSKVQKIRSVFNYKYDLDYLSLENNYKLILEECLRDTMIGIRGLTANIDSVSYVNSCNTKGAIVECGVWKGGSIKSMILRLLQLKDTEREIYLFDTFQGMTEPSILDINPDKKPALKTYKNIDFCYAPKEYVQEKISRSNYPESKIHYIEGDVKETIPLNIREINEIAVLRLDTDWYDSTKIELEYLYPKLVINGVLIIDDYGYWAGARKAVDDFFASQRIKPFLFRVDRTRRLYIKTR